MDSLLMSTISFRPALSYMYSLNVCLCQVGITVQSIYKAEYIRNRAKQKHTDIFPMIILGPGILSFPLFSFPLLSYSFSLYLLFSIRK